jgi:integrase
MARRGNGEGSIRKRKDGRWEGRCVVGRDPETGAPIRKSVFGRTRKDCAEALSKAMAKAAAGLYMPVSKMLYSDWVQAYLWDIKQAGLKPNTFSQYVYLSSFLDGSALWDMKIADIRRHHIQSYIDSLVPRYGAWTIKSIYKFVRGTFSEAEAREIVEANPVKNIKIPPAKAKPMRILTEEETRRLLTAVKSHRLAAAFIVAITTGMREGELAALKWADYENAGLHIERDAVRIDVYDPVTRKKTGTELIIQDTPKTSAGVRFVPILPIAIDALSRHRMRQNDEKMKNRRLYVDSGYIFTNEVGAVYEPSYYRKTLHKIMDAAGLSRVRFHALRHSFATRGLELEISPKELQALLGHETPEMVMHYQHLLEQRARVSIDKLQNVFGK